MLKNNDLKFNSINTKSIIGFSLLLSSSYYFYKYSSFTNKNFFLFIGDFFTLFVFSLIFFYFLKKIFIKLEFFLHEKIYKLIFSFFLSYLFIQVIRGFLYLINSKLTISNLIINYITLFQNTAFLSNRLLIYLLPFFICFLIIIFNQKKFEKFIRFFSIIGFVFFTVLVFREFNNYITVLKVLKEVPFVNFKYETQNIKENNKKVLWIIFDGFDPQITFQNEKILNNLPNFKNFKDTSVIHEKMYPPAEKTINSLPAILMGLETKGHLIKDKKYYLKKKDDNFVKFNYENSIFGRLNKSGIISSVFSSVLEYCSAYIIPNNFKMCIEKKRNKSIPIAAYFDGIYFTFFPINKINFFTSIIFNSNKKNLNNEINYENFYNIGVKKEHINSNDLDGFNTIFLSDVKRSLKKSNLTFIHLYVPHPGNQSYAKKVTGKFPQDDFVSYLINLKLSDIALGKLLKTIEQYEDHMIILSSDHWFRSRDKNRSNIYPALFMGKISDQNDAFTIKNSESSSIYIQELIYNFFISEIKNHNDMTIFLKSRTEHSTYVNLNN
jgi:hypothetical protein